jgi:hypothetical protein
VIHRTSAVRQEIIPELLQQSFATSQTPAAVLWPARFPFIFAPDICNTPGPMFTGPSVVMQNLPFLRLALDNFPQEHAKRASYDSGPRWYGEDIYLKLGI